MTQVGELFRLGQALFAEQLPATIKIGSQSYAAGTCGKQLQAVLELGGFKQQWTVSFWVPGVAGGTAFAAAGQPEPLPKTALAWDGADWHIETVKPDPAGGGTMVLTCTQPPQ